MQDTQIYKQLFAHFTSSRALLLNMFAAQLYQSASCAMRKISDDKYEFVCMSCISFLQKSMRAEMGLLRCAVSQTEVRTVMNAMLLSESNIILAGSDVYLVAEVLHCSLKAMSVSLLSEWYENFTLESKNLSSLQSTLLTTRLNIHYR